MRDPKVFLLDPRTAYPRGLHHSPAARRQRQFSRLACLHRKRFASPSSKADTPYIPLRPPSISSNSAWVESTAPPFQPGLFFLLPEHPQSPSLNSRYTLIRLPQRAT